jgi:hypothetical protein
LTINLSGQLKPLRLESEKLFLDLMVRRSLGQLAAFHSLPLAPFRLGFHLPAGISVFLAT